VECWDVTSRDGTTIRAWRSCRAPGSLPVVISNGLGTPPEAWPSIVGDPARSDAVSWYHRGTAGAPRPADPSRLRVQDHVDDLIAVMDDRGIDRALLAGWSLGVTIAFEACRLHPDRVAGILSVAGVPGALVVAMGGPLPVPGPMRPWFATTVPRGLRMASPGLQLVSKGLPLVRPTAWAIRHTGFVLPAARSELLLSALRELRHHDWRWYLTLALAAEAFDNDDLSSVRVPTTIVAGRWASSPRCAASSTRPTR